MPEKLMLDPCCGTRMFYQQKHHPNVIFGDIRRETITVSDQSNGKIGGTRTLCIEPDTLMDFRNLPFADGSFKLVAFDPPHLLKCGKKSWLAAKYGRLSESWKNDIQQGFKECFRVLEDDGVLIFKWNQTDIPLNQILTLTPYQPLFGQQTGRGNKTFWQVFMKHANP